MNDVYALHINLPFSYQMYPGALVSMYLLPHLHEGLWSPYGTPTCMPLPKIVQDGIQLKIEVDYIIPSIFYMFEKMF